jgi:hypothetical protein
MKSHLNPNQKLPEIKEMTQIISKEWNGLDEQKKNHFNIPVEVQKRLREQKKMNSLPALRDAVLENVARNTEKISISAIKSAF